MLTEPAGESPAEPVESRRETIVRTLSLKKALLAGVVALAVGASALGIAAAQQTPTASPTSVPGFGHGPGAQQTTPGQDRREQFLSALAAKLNVSTDRLRQAMEETRRELGLPEHRAGGPRKWGAGSFGPALGVAAQTIGITVEQLHQELPGKTLADVASAHNVDPATVARTLKDAANARIDQAAAAGRIPSDQVTQVKQRASDQIDQLMTRQVPAEGFQPRGPRAGRAGGF
jgi:hypothetical protein